MMHIVFNVVPQNRRGVSQSLFSILTAAGNLAPVLVGALTGGTLGTYALSDVFLYVVSGSYLISGPL